MAAVRNPLLAFLATLVESAVFAPLLSIPIIMLQFYNFPFLAFFYSFAAFAFAGILAGRSGTFSLAALPVGFIGGFLGYMAWATFVVPPVMMLYALVYGAIAGLGAWASASWHMSRVKPMIMRLEIEEKRQCSACGARVAPKARACWSCQASLSRMA